MWYDSTTRHRINRVRSARKKARLHPTTNNTNKLETAEKELISHMIVTKANYETSLVNEFASSNCNKIYKYIRSTSGADGLPSAMHNESTSVTSDLDKATLFNNFFESVHSKALPNVTVQSRSLLPTPVLNDFQISETDVLAALSHLDPSKATGIDGMGPKILKACSAALSPVISHLFTVGVEKAPNFSYFQIRRQDLSPKL